MTLRTWSFVALAALAVAVWGCGSSSSPQSCGQIVVVDQNLDTPATWTTGTTYHVTAPDFKVTATLTIEPGVVVKSTAGNPVWITGVGQIVSMGTADNPVIFTAETDEDNGCSLGLGAVAPGRGYWKGIQLLGVSDGAPMSQLTYTNVYYAGAGGNSAVELGSTPASVEGCVLAHNANFGLSASDVNQQITIESNLFYDNDRPLEISAAISVTDADNNAFHWDTVGNDQNGIFIHHEILGVNSGEGKLVVWGVTEVPFVMSGNLFSVAQHNVLEVLDNVIVKSPLQSAGIQFFTDNLHVGAGAIFTSLLDDAHGGDTNGDGAATGPADGDWAGIWDEDFTSNDPLLGQWIANPAILYDEIHDASTSSGEHQFTFPQPTS